MLAMTVDRLDDNAEQEVCNMLLALYKASSSGDISFFEKNFFHTERTVRLVPVERAEDVNSFPPGKSVPMWGREPKVSLVDETVFVGTAPAEFIMTHANIREFWKSVFQMLKELPGNKYPNGGLPLRRSPRIVISGHGRVAWIADEPTLRLSRDYKCRLTAVLMREEISNRWMFTQAHLSLGVPDQDLMALFTQEEKSQIAQVNQPALLLGSCVYLRQQQIPIKNWLASVGQALQPLWEPFKGKGSGEIAKHLALNLASMGATVHDVSSQGREASIKLTWQLQSMLDRLPGASWADVDEVLAMFKGLAGYVGWRCNVSRQGEAITIKLAP
ncbi:MAG: hypothetical protein JXB05_13175 [Myxococcaceae bacterium]|nr:hypothetical protein [Myxococcaceae bacterium]